MCVCVWWGGDTFNFAVFLAPLFRRLGLDLQACLSEYAEEPAVCLQGTDPELRLLAQEARSCRLNGGGSLRSESCDLSCLASAPWRGRLLGVGSRLCTQPLPGPPTVSLSFPWFWGAAHGDPGCQPCRGPTAPEAFVEAATVPHPHPAALPLGPGAQ